MLPYLEVQKSSVGADDSVRPVEMPNVIDLTITEAKKTLQELGLEVEANGEGETVTNQLPKKGIQVNTGTTVSIYAE